MDTAATDYWRGKGTFGKSILGQPLETGDRSKHVTGAGQSESGMPKIFHQDILSR